ncbi:hypothetical protein [Nocardioides sp. BYT-33-1]|uniref:hypothetical protein n=1 Tax=Nocardioides sp. BYT-33-1 TaxID=3416952 RepID=UPI003F532150
MRGLWFGRYRLFWPIVSGDEYGRRTLAVPLIPGLLAVVVPLWTCRCSECDQMRAQTDDWGL